jgi:hypothetical protein
MAMTLGGCVGRIVEKKLGEAARVVSTDEAKKSIL